MSAQWSWDQYPYYRGSQITNVASAAHYSNIKPGIGNTPSQGSHALFIILIIVCVLILIYGIVIFILYYRQSWTFKPFVRSTQGNVDLLNFSGEIIALDDSKKKALQTIIDNSSKTNWKVS